MLARYSATKAALGPVTFKDVGAVVSGNSPTVALPTDWAAGDLLVIVMAANSSAVSTPSGWTSLFNSTAASSTGTAVFCKKATGSESSVTLSGGGGQSRSYMLSFSCAGGTPAFDTNATEKTGSAAAMSTNTLTTSANDELILNIYHADSTGSANSTTLPTGNTTIAGSSGSIVRTVRLCYEAKSTAGTTTARTSTLTTASPWRALAVALKPGP